MTATRRARLLGLLILLAAPLPGRSADACRADAARFCQRVPPGGGRILACLRSRAADLSPECQAELDLASERVKGFAEACRPEAERFCRGIRPGQGRVAACLRAREGELSPACREAMAR